MAWRSPKHLPSGEFSPRDRITIYGGSLYPRHSCISILPKARSYFDFSKIIIFTDHVVRTHSHGSLVKPCLEVGENLDRQGEERQETLFSEACFEQGKSHLVLHLGIVMPIHSRGGGFGTTQRICITCTIDMGRIRVIRNHSNGPSHSFWKIYCHCRTPYLQTLKRMCYPATLESLLRLNGVVTEYQLSPPLPAYLLS
jgi:hypothetical protein